jgi:hypothetical protein
MNREQRRHMVPVTPQRFEHVIRGGTPANVQKEIGDRLSRCLNELAAQYSLDGNQLLSGLMATLWGAAQQLGVSPQTLREFMLRSADAFDNLNKLNSQNPSFPGSDSGGIIITPGK